jgi:hypothetical protein
MIESWFAQFIGAHRLVSSTRTKMTPASMNAPPVNSMGDGFWPSSSHAYSTTKKQER